MRIGMLRTPFTVMVDKLEGCTTGVSAHDRAATIQALADPNSKPSDFGRPGHISPLYAQEEGVLRRAGHTEAAVDLARLAGLRPAAALIEIMNEDGTMARMPQLQEVAKKFDLKIISIRDLIDYRLRNEKCAARSPRPRRQSQLPRSRKRGREALRSRKPQSSCASPPRLRHRLCRRRPTRLPHDTSLQRRQAARDCVRREKAGRRALRTQAQAPRLCQNLLL